MARRGLNGQLNMFDFFRELEAAGPPDGEVEMVSLMPDFEEEEIEIEAALKIVEDSQSVAESETVMEPQSIAKSDNPTEPDQVEEKKSKARKRNSKKSNKPDVQLGELQQDSSKATNELPETSELSERSEQSELSRTPQTSRETNFTTNFSERPIMRRSYTTPEGIIEIAYLSYNKVRLSEPEKEPVITEFLSSKEAVDYYVEQMQNLQSLYGDEA